MGHFHKRHSSQTRVKSNNDCISYIRELQMVVILHSWSLLGHLIGTEELLTLLVSPVLFLCSDERHCLLFERSKNCTSLMCVHCVLTVGYFK